MLIRLLPLLVFLSACQPSNDIRGNLISSDDKNKLKVGKSTQEEVINIVGSPSIKTSDGKWLYIGKETSTVAFFNPSTNKKLVIAASFNDKGILQSLNKLKLTENRISIDSEITPIKGTDLTIIGQALDNLRRIAAAKKRRQHES